MLLEILKKLLLKRAPSMVFLLSGDVARNRIGVGLADSERAITGLPRKLRACRPPFMNEL